MLGGAAVGSAPLDPVAADAEEVVSLSLVPQEIVAGREASGRVDLRVAAQTAVRVAIASSDASVARVPSAVTIPPLARSASFPVQTSPGAAGCARITARPASGASHSVELFVAPRPDARLSPVRVHLESDAVVATGTVLAHVELPRAAADGGTAVVLASGNPTAASVPASVLVPPGATRQRFVIKTAVKGTTTCAVITATVNGFSGRALLKIVGISG